MKNRYGMDGLTFYLNADTSTGHFEITDAPDNDDETPTTSSSNNSNSYDSFDNFDKKLLANKFFELNS